MEDFLGRVLTTMRICELEGKYFWNVRELASVLDSVSAEVVRVAKSTDVRYIELWFDGTKIFARLTDEGRKLADGIMGLKKIPLSIRVKRREPWIIDLTTLYEATKITFMACRTHHFYFEPYFLRGRKIVEPEEAQLVLGIVKCTDRDGKERMPLRLLSDKNMPQRIGLLFQYSLRRYEEVVEADVRLAKALLATIGLRNLWGATIHNGILHVKGKRIDLRLL